MRGTAAKKRADECPDWKQIREQASKKTRVVDFSISLGSLQDDHKDTLCSEKTIPVVKYTELQGFSAAGILPFSTDGKEMYIYVISEKRDGVDAYNFPGGKRDSIFETPYAVAKRELGYIIFFLTHGLDCSKYSILFV